jgi:hypothetical protein
MQKKKDTFEVGGWIQRAGMPFEILRFGKILVVALILLGVSIVFLSSKDMNPAIGYGVICISLILLALGIISLVRTSRMVASKPILQSQKIQLEPNEKMTGYATGLIRYGWRGGHALFGSGQINATENAMIATDKRVCFVTVPIEGAGKIIGGMDISTAQWMLSQDKIKQVLEDLIKSKNLQDVLDSVTVNSSIIRQNIVYAKPRGELTIAIKTTDGQKIMYNFLKKEELEKAVNVLN